MRINEARRQLAELRASEIADLERHEKAGTSFDAAELENDGKRAKQIGDLITEIQALEGIQKRAQEARAAAAAAGADAGGGREDRGNGSPDLIEKRRDVFRRFLRGDINLPQADMEFRAQSVGVYTAGGALVTPVEMLQTLVKAIDDAVFIRGLATKFTVTASEALGVPTIESDPADADWTSELATGSETQVGFGGRELKPQPIAKLIKISNKLLRMVPNIDQIVMERVAYKFAVTQEKAFISGDGIGKPLGVLTASDQGIPTSRDIDSASSSAFTWDKIYDLEASMKQGYRTRMVWLTHRAHLNSIRKLKSASDGRYMLDINTANNGGIVQMLNRPLYLSEHFNSATTVGTYGLLVGDFSFYYIADALGMTTQVLKELYAASNSTGIIGRMECDAMPVLGEAFGRIKFAS